MRHYWGTAYLFDTGWVYLRVLYGVQLLTSKESTDYIMSASYIQCTKAGRDKVHPAKFKTNFINRVNGCIEQGGHINFLTLFKAEIQNRHCGVF